MPILFIGVTLKWLVRLTLIAFYGVVGYYYTKGTNILLWLTRNHPWVTVGILVATIMAFVYPFFHIRRKTKDGGETDMRKLAWFVLIIFTSIFAIAVVCAIDPNNTGKMVSNFLKGLGGTIWITLSNSWINLGKTAGSTGTYFLIYTIGVLMLGGIMWIALTKAKKKLPSIKKPSLSKIDLNTQREPSEPEYAPTPSSDVALKTEEVVAE